MYIERRYNIVEDASCQGSLAIELSGVLRVRS